MDSELLQRIVSNIKSLRSRVSQLESRTRVAALPRDGRDGKDGESPDPDLIKKSVLSEIPVPKDGRDGRDGKDGKDGESPRLTDIASLVLSKIPTPKDGVSPDPDVIAQKAAQQIGRGPMGQKGERGQRGERGPVGPPGPQGAKGDPGESITDVRVVDGDLVVFIDGKRKVVGKLPGAQAAASFTPGGGGGSERRRVARLENEIDLLTSISQVSVTHPADPTDAQVTVVGTGNRDLKPPTGFVTLLNGYEPVVNVGPVFSILADGRVQVNVRGYIRVDGYADVKQSVNATSVGVAFSIERDGVETFSPRSVHARMPNAGDIGHLSGEGAFLAEKGDIIGVGFASDKSGTISVSSSSLVFGFVRQV